ncbi:MAG: hypothetical protein GY941_08200 [Planctomycetes bacterium]|nr:hypothetical protein [Planctomycetota bacterium]
MEKPTISERHLKYYLYLFQQLKEKQGLTPSQEKDIIALLALFMESLPQREIIPETYTRKALAVRNILRFQLQSHGFTYAGAQKEIYQEVKEYIPLITKLAHAYHLA